MTRREIIANKADLGRANLSGANLSGANLSWADLHEANLSEANLSVAIGLPRAPAVAGLNQAILAALAAGGSLDMATWHTCETTHCRAGWTVTLAGEAGKKLETELGTNVAAALITLASCPWMERVPDWFATNAAALAAIRACAEREGK